MTKPEYDIWFIKDNVVSTNCRIYKRRWFMLFMFVLYAVSNSLHWLQFSGISDVVVKFYNVPYNSAEWTVIVYLQTYLALCWLGWIIIEELGLRWSIIIGMIGTCVAAWLKVLTVTPDRFHLLLSAQSIAGLCQILLATVPPKLAATWFGPDEVSTACGIGVFGILLGIALGHSIPPTFINVGQQIEGIKLSLYSINLGIAIFSCMVLLLLLRYFEENPPIPPSPAQMKVVYGREPFSLSACCKRIFSNSSYRIILVSHAIIIASMSTVLALLNDIVLDRYFKESLHTGSIINVVAVFGMVGCITGGVVIDKYKKFKATALIAYMVSFAAMVCFTVAVMENFTLVYFTAAILGFSMASMITIGYEIATELTYPEPQSVSCGLLVSVSMGLSVSFKYAYTYLLYNTGETSANLAISGALLIGALLIIRIRRDYRRQAAQVNVIETSI